MKGQVLRQIPHGPARRSDAQSWFWPCRGRLLARALVRVLPAGHGARGRRGSGVGSSGTSPSSKPRASVPGARQRPAGPRARAVSSTPILRRLDRRPARIGDPRAERDLPRSRPSRPSASWPLAVAPGALGPVGRELVPGWLDSPSWLSGAARGSGNSRSLRQPVDHPGRGSSRPGGDPGGTGRRPGNHAPAT